jgi:hypothetical protein
MILRHWLSAPAPSGPKTLMNFKTISNILSQDNAVLFLRSSSFQLGIVNTQKYSMNEYLPEELAVRIGI